MIRNVERSAENFHLDQDAAPSASSRGQFFPSRGALICLLSRSQVSIPNFFNSCGEASS